MQVYINNVIQFNIWLSISNYSMSVSIIFRIMANWYVEDTIIVINQCKKFYPTLPVFWIIRYAKYNSTFRRETK